MNVLRNQRKDVRRTLKTMKIQQSKKYTENLLNNSVKRSSSKQINHRTISFVYKDNRDKSQETKKVSAYRYGERIPSENDRSSIYKIYRPAQHMSVQMKDHKFLKITSQSSSKQKNARGRQAILKKFSTYMGKAQRKVSHNNRVKTYEAIRQEAYHQPSLIQVSASSNLKNFSQRNNNEQIIEQAENLFSIGKFEQSKSLVEKVLQGNNEHRKALYICGMIYLNQKNYLKSLSNLNILLELQPTYNKSAFIVVSMCYTYLNKLDQALLRTNTCISYFPDYFQAHLQKAKVYIAKQNYEEAILSLKKTLKLQSQNYDAALLLGQCYIQLGKHKMALNIFSKLAKRQNIKEKGYRVLLLKANCEKQLQNYQAYISTMELYIKLGDSCSSEELAYFNYEIALAYYYLKDYSNSIMSLQETFSFKSKEYCTSAMILLTIIHILRRDYYEAYHTLLRKQHLQIQEDKIIFYEKFCEGVINLMKRKFGIGLQKLQQISEQIQQSLQDGLKIKIIKIYPMYLSYAYFCEGRTHQCKRIIQKCLDKKQPELEPYHKSLEFNLHLCNGLLQYESLNYQQASKHFLKSIAIFPNKPQGFLYYAGSQLKMYLRDISVAKSIYNIKQNLKKCIKNIKQLNNNYASSVFYFKSCVSAYLHEWDQAINEIDESIERGEDNDPSCFYLRALILGCCQNYQQAISDVNVAISINDHEPSYYLFRSKCLQIQGDGNKAFLDLQTYIALKPDDSEIHKYAGHLLFQNGAFEDAIQAYQNGQISQQSHNLNVFLTRSKTYFLLGNYEKSIQDMQTANRLKPEDNYICYDLKVLKLVNNIFIMINQKQNSLHSVDDGAKIKQRLFQLTDQQQENNYGKIFRQIELTVLKALTYYYLDQFRQSSRFFKEAIKLKQNSLFTDQDDYEEEQRDKLYYISQMQYNKAICHLKLKEETAALKCLDSCKLQPESKTYQKYTQIKKFIQDRESDVAQKQFDLFSQKNKMSRYLKSEVIELDNKRIIHLKLCIPFPKVEPPQISPKIQTELLEQIDMLKIQRKPEAPWILRQENSIQFTQKMENYSRLDLNGSQLSQVEKAKKNSLQLYNDQQDAQDQSNQIDLQSLKQLKAKLRLDQNIQKKLNKFIIRNQPIF